MTTTTIEQFREQCVKLGDSLRKSNHGWNSFSYTNAINDFSSAIAALPLPVMPSQDAEVMPEQAEPVATNPFGYIVFSDKGNIRVWWKAIDIDAAKKHCEKHQWRLEKLNIDEANTALLARIAELEAESKKNSEIIIAMAADLAEINGELDLEPDDGGADPIIFEILRLKERIIECEANHAQD